MVPASITRIRLIPASPPYLPPQGVTIRAAGPLHRDTRVLVGKFPERAPALGDPNAAWRLYREEKPEGGAPSGSTGPKGGNNTTGGHHSAALRSLSRTKSFASRCLQTVFVGFRHSRLLAFVNSANLAVSHTEYPHGNQALHWMLKLALCVLII